MVEATEHNFFQVIMCTTMVVKLADIMRVASTV